MGTLVFVCPTSGREVFTGLEMIGKLSGPFQGTRRDKMSRL